MAPDTDNKSDAETDTGADSKTDAQTEDHIRRWTDDYFLKTKKTVERFGDKQVTYAVFMRRPVIFAPKLMVAWLEGAARARGSEFDIELNYDEGQWAGGGEPLAYITGPLSKLVDLETLYLQKLGAACVAAKAPGRARRAN